MCVWVEDLKQNYAFRYICIIHTHSPSGWDNEKKIGILYEHMKSLSPSEPYEKIIMTPKTSQVRH